LKLTRSLDRYALLFQLGELRKFSEVGRCHGVMGSGHASVRGAVGKLSLLGRSTFQVSSIGHASLETSAEH